MSRTPLDGPGTREGVFTVSELAGAIRQGLDRLFPGPVILEGELSNVKRSEPAGHYYFTMKDAASSLRGVMFRGAATSLSFLPKDGMHVLVRGRLSYYEPRGEIQLVAETMGPAGLGRFHLEFQRVRAILEAEGLLFPDRKRPIPAFPRAVALVTSPQGAAVWDFLRICDQQNQLIPVVVVPARMQGNDAVDEIIRALALVSGHPGVDIAVITRGGGSAEDLWSFNSLPLARAILGCRVPVVTAIGHEVDVTVADLVADLRVATPTEAAKRIFFDQGPFLEGLVKLRSRMEELQEARFRREERRILSFRLSSGSFGRRLSHAQLAAVRAQERLAGAMRFRLSGEESRKTALAGSLVHPHQRIYRGSLRVASHQEQLKDLGKAVLDHADKALTGLIRRLSPDRITRIASGRLEISRSRLLLSAAVRREIARRDHGLSVFRAHLQEGHPERPLSRGFFILKRMSDGRMVTPSSVPAPGERVLARTEGLSLSITIEERLTDNQ